MSADVKPSAPVETLNVLPAAVFDATSQRTESVVVPALAETFNGAFRLKVFDPAPIDPIAFAPVVIDCPALLKIWQLLRFPTAAPLPGVNVTGIEVTDAAF